MTKGIQSVFIDLTGEKFGKLLVIKRIENNKQDRVTWECLCDCGNTKNASSIDLKFGNIKSCGCLKIKNLIGKKFDKLLVLKRVDNDSSGNSQWLCKCDCGNERIINRGYLKYRKSIKSCGCSLYNDLTGQRFGRLLVVSKAKKIMQRIAWNCICDCGNECIVIGKSLKGGNTKSCGCYREELRSRPFGEASFNRLYYSYRNKAKGKNVSFSLDKNTFKILTNGNCFYCGKPPLQIQKGVESYGDYIYNGIDRVDNKRGYEIDNCVSCCGMCNKAKNATPKDVFYNWIAQVYNYSVKYMDLSS